MASLSVKGGQHSCHECLLSPPLSTSPSPSVPEDLRSRFSRLELRQMGIAAHSSAINTRTGANPYQIRELNPVGSSPVCLRPFGNAAVCLTSLRLSIRRPLPISARCLVAQQNQAPLLRRSSWCLVTRTHVFPKSVFACVRIWASCFSLESSPASYHWC